MIIIEYEQKENLVLEYTRLCLNFTDQDITLEHKSTIKTRLNEIRTDLGMGLI